MILYKNYSFTKNTLFKLLNIYDTVIFYVLSYIYLITFYSNTIIFNSYTLIVYIPVSIYLF